MEVVKQNCLLLPPSLVGVAGRRRGPPVFFRSERGDENGDDAGDDTGDNFRGDSSFHLRFLSCVKLAFGLLGKSQNLFRGIRPAYFPLN